jgi:hypothetical protein
LPGLCQLLEGIGDDAGGLLAHFAARFVGHRAGNLLNGVRPLAVGQSHGVPGFGRQASDTCNRQGHGLAGEIGAGLGDGRDWIVEGQHLRHARALGFRIWDECAARI